MITIMLNLQKVMLTMTKGATTKGAEDHHQVALQWIKEVVEDLVALKAFQIGKETKIKIKKISHLGYKRITVGTMVVATNTTKTNIMNNHKINNQDRIALWIKN